jgi:hypothetical protein
MDWVSQGRLRKPPLYTVVVETIVLTTSRIQRLLAG